MKTITNTTTDKKAINKNQHINGWGIDANPKNNPTYPMKHYTGADHQRLNYTRPKQQEQHMEILHSNERPGLTSVFGTSVPPQGLSGMLRRYAFKFSEGSSAHWLTLILADRVNAVEGIIDDVKHGYVPNFFVERGWRAEWKYNRQKTVKKLIIGTAVTSAVIAILIYRNKNKKLQAS
ncbi:MAG TPA: hypothetical protein VD884_09730 [Ohtaekwangia sp.]|nr:hypothetical protein [Ohtaekwangia sp.]